MPVDRETMPVPGDVRGDGDLVERREGPVHRGEVPPQDRLPALLNTTSQDGLMHILEKNA